MTLEHQILRAVETSPLMSMPDVVHKLQAVDPTVFESDIRRMVWRLVDRGQLVLRDDRKLVVRGL